MYAFTTYNPEDWGTNNAILEGGNVLNLHLTYLESGTKIKGIISMQERI